MTGGNWIKNTSTPLSVT